MPPSAERARWLAQGYLALVQTFGVIPEEFARRPWDAIRAAMQAHLADSSSTDLFFGCLFLAAGPSQPRDRGKHEPPGDCLAR